MSVSRPTPRREFLGQVASAAVVLAGTACAAPLAATQAPAPAAPPAPATPAGPVTWDDTWAQGLASVAHKAVFDSPEIGDGIGLWQAWLYMRGYKAALGAGDDAVRAVIVMRHMAIPMALGDALWDKYELGKRLKLKDPATGKPARRNPFVTVAADDKHALISPETTLPALRARGAVLLGCNMAAMGFAAQLAEKSKADVAAVRAEVKAGLVPGVQLMPSGVYATLRAQEAGCAFMRSQG